MTNTGVWSKGLSARLLGVGLLMGTHCLAAASGSVSGTVVDEAGNAVGGAHVLLNHALPANGPRFAAPPVVTGTTAAVVVANARGAFSFEGIPAGPYVMCAESTIPGLLDPCHWSASAPNVTVSDGKQTANVQIMMSKGAVIPIHVDDPLGLLKPVNGPVGLDFRIHFITAKGHHYTAPIQAGSDSGRDHTITVPFGTPITVKVVSAKVNVTDGLGKSLSPQGTNMTIPIGSTPAPLRYIAASIK